MPGMTLGRPGGPKTKDLGGEKPIIITISGDLGSGKSLLSSALVERWEADRYSTGMVQRRIADRMGITTLELNQRAETDKSIDDQIDSVFKNLARTPKNLIVDSRMAFHFLPMSFKIKLEVHPRIAAERIQGDTSRIGEGDYKSVDDIEAAITARKASERARFKKYYDADIEDHAGYDLVINTTDCPPHAVSDLANEAVALWKKGVRIDKLWIAPRHLYPLADPETLNAQAVEKLKVNWPLPEGWPKGAISGVKTDGKYVITKGAEWVSAGLKAGRELVPVSEIAGETSPPAKTVTESWENAHKFKHLAG